MRSTRGIVWAWLNRPALAHRHQRSDIVEHIDEQEHENDLEEAQP
jgi:hypothetical protein